MNVAALLGPHDGLNTLYARDTGDDFAVGDQANPLQTLDGISRRTEMVLYGDRKLWFDITDLNDDREVLQGLVTPCTAGRDRFNLTPTEHPSFLIETPWMLRAVPADQLSIPAFVVNADPVHGMIEVTVTGAGWTSDQWQGYTFAGSGLLECGKIDRNTTDTLFVAYAGTVTAPAMIRRETGVLKFGITDPLESFQPGLDLIVSGMALIQGVEFKTNGTGAALQVNMNDSGILYLTECWFDGLEVKGSGTVIIDACYVTGLIGINGATVSVRRSVVFDTTFNNHGGDIDIINCRVRQNGALGSGGTGAFFGTFDIDSCEVLDADGNGVEYTGGVRSTVADTVISGSGGNAISAVNAGKLVLDNVQGSANTGYGLGVTDQCGIEVRGGTAVSGLIGEIVAGALGDKLWSEVPFTDPATLIRVADPTPVPVVPPGSTLIERLRVVSGAIESPQGNATLFQPSLGVWEFTLAAPIASDKLIFIGQVENTGPDTRNLDLEIVSTTLVRMYGTRRIGTASTPFNFDFMVWFGAQP